MHIEKKYNTAPSQKELKKDENSQKQLLSESQIIHTNPSEIDSNEDDDQTRRPHFEP
jgi:hypothetical protein